MSNILQARNLHISYGNEPLLDDVSFSVNKRDRIGIVGRNGSGKSTLLKIIGSEIQPDEGEIVKNEGIKIAKLDQVHPHEGNEVVYKVMALADEKCGQYLGQWFDAEQHGQKVEDDVVDSLNRTNAWEIDQQINKLVSQFGLDKSARFNTLSGGQKRRVMVARTFLHEPNLLLLDEPTNHLDIRTIEWLESMLVKQPIAQIIVSHDRRFLNKIATQIFDLDRGRLTSFSGNFEAYLTTKFKMLEDEQNEDKAFDKKLAQEEKWIRTGIKARRTRNEGRVRALKAMRKQRAQRRQETGNSNIKINQAEASGKIVVEAKGIGYRHREDEVIIQDFSTLIVRGDKIGIVGDNGCGKSTLVNLLTGSTKPQQGTIKFGTKISLAYLDQQRSEINDEQSVIDNVAGGQSMITVNGKSMHIMSYLQDFLFPPARCRTPASALSGGERNRLLLAKLFTKPFNVLVLDEPTNDLDIDTLEILEQKLVEYEGTLLVVSHDRAFLNNIVTSLLVFDENQAIKEFIGDYEEWQQYQSSLDKPIVAQQKVKKSSARKKSSQKLSYNETRELAKLPQQIEKLEQQITALHDTFSQQGFYQRPEQEIVQSKAQLDTLQTQLDKLYTRWESLEEVAKN